jgi:hypothetical protein
MSNAETFFKEFVERVTWEEYHQSYINDAEFTPIITNVIKDIIEKMGWIPTTEYFRIDVIGYESKWESVKDKAHNAGLGAYLWNMKAAVEHENSKSAWTDELIKLMQIRCPLKVIITYNYYDERPEGDLKKLAVAADLMQKVDSFESIKRDGEELLIIIGNGCSKKTKKSDYESFDYKGYLFNYDSNKFVELEASNQ